MVTIREHGFGGGVLCGKVVLNRYEIWTAICRAALVKAGLPSGGDFGIDNRWTDDVPDALSFEMYDGDAKIVIREVAPEGETIEQRHVRKVRQILGETRKSVLDALEGKLAAARPELEAIVAGLDVEDDGEVRVEAEVGAVSTLDVARESGPVEADMLLEAQIRQHGSEEQARLSLYRRNEHICKLCLELSNDVPRSKYCEKVRGGDPFGKNQHMWLGLETETGIEAWGRRLAKGRLA